MRYLIIIAIFITVLIGCSGNEAGLTLPDNPTQDMHGDVNTIHGLWGYWQGFIDTDAGTLEFIPLRVGELHLNALRFLEPPPNFRLTLEGPLQISGNVVDVNIGIRHPFLGLDQYTGFDVCGIFIASGSQSGYTDAGILMPGQYDTRLLNPDGYSRWWNPVEFPVNPGTIFGYTDGLLGTQHATADFNATLNGYKYFCDDLDDAADPLSDVNPEGRGIFSAGQKNVRHYKIYMASGLLVFNYAIDACWKKPSGSPPHQVPDDFPPQANRAEAWRVSITEIENTLWSTGSAGGGNLRLSVDVYDWFDADMNTIRVESPGNMLPIESLAPVGGGTGFSTYEIDILDANPSGDEMRLLISVVSHEADFQGFIPGTNTASYFAHSAPVEQTVVDCSTNPQITSTIDTYDAVGIARVGNYLFMGNSLAGLDVIDISNEALPVIVGHVSTYAFGVYAVGDYVYVAGYTGGLKIIDVSDKTNPYIAGSAHTPYCLDVNVVGNYAYVADSAEGLIIADVTDKTAPFVVSSTPAGKAHGIAVAGDYAYIADHDFGLRIVDVSDKENPVIVGNLETGKCHEVAVDGDYAYLACHTHGFKVVDITVKSDPVEVGSYETYDGWGIKVIGDCVYYCDHQGGLLVFDVSVKSSPVLVGEMDTSRAHDIEFSGDYGYVTDHGSGLRVMKLF